MKMMRMKRELLTVCGVALAALGLMACGGVEPLDEVAPESLGSVEQREQAPYLFWASGSPSYSGGFFSVSGSWSRPYGSGGVHLEYVMDGILIKTEDPGGASGGFFASIPVSCGTLHQFVLWARAAETPQSSVTEWSSLSYSFTPSCSPPPPPPPPSCTPCDPDLYCQVSGPWVSCGTRSSAEAFQSCEGWCVARDACGSNVQICPYQ